LRDVEKLRGCPIERVDKEYRGHDEQNPRRVFISSQKRDVFGVIKRELLRRSAIEPIIGRLKAEAHLGRCYLNAGDAANYPLSRRSKLPTHPAVELRSLDRVAAVHAGLAT
jgi:IS5 family transposase